MAARMVFFSHFRIDLNCACALFSHTQHLHRCSVNSRWEPCCRLQ
jgi:hypothetical protein